MGLTPVELQQTDRFFVFSAPLTCSKVKWPTAAARTRAIGESTRQPTSTYRSTSGLPLPQQQRQSPRPQMTSEGAAASAVSVGARKVLLEDVLLVAVHGARVDLHPASLDKACPVPCNAPHAGDKPFETRYPTPRTSLTALLLAMDVVRLSVRASIIPRRVSRSALWSIVHPKWYSFACRILHVVVLLQLSWCCSMLHSRRTTTVTSKPASYLQQYEVVHRRVVLIFMILEKHNSSSIIPLVATNDGDKLFRRFQYVASPRGIVLGAVYVSCQIGTSGLMLRSTLLFAAVQASCEHVLAE